MAINRIYYFFIFLLGIGIVFSQDPPEEFEYNQGFNQSFYFFMDIEIEGEPLDEFDWIGAFKTYDESQGGECVQDEMNFDETMGGMCSGIGQCYSGFEGCVPEDCPASLDVDNDGLLSSCACPDLNDDNLLASLSLNLCIGSRMYGDCIDSRNCDVPVIGYDGNCYSGGYIEPGEFPFFKIYDHSEGEVYYATPSENFAWQSNEYHLIDSLDVEDDCNGDLGGNAEIDPCGECCSGNTSTQCSYFEDEYN